MAEPIEVAIVAYVLYRALLLIQGTRAVQMLIGRWHWIATMKAEPVC